MGELKSGHESKKEQPKLKELMEKVDLSKLKPVHENFVIKEDDPLDDAEAKMRLIGGSIREQVQRHSPDFIKLYEKNIGKINQEKSGVASEVTVPSGDIPKMTNKMAQEIMKKAEASEIVGNPASKPNYKNIVASDEDLLSRASNSSEDVPGIDYKMAEKIKKLKAWKISGNPVEDLMAYIKITGLRLDALPEVRKGLKNGDSVVALDYLRTLKKAKDNRGNIFGLPDANKRIMEIEGEIIEKIIKKAQFKTEEAS